MITNKNSLTGWPAFQYMAHHFAFFSLMSVPELPYNKNKQLESIKWIGWCSNLRSRIIITRC